MENSTNVSIVIQARSTSTRFPRKIFEKIGSKPVLQHVIDACHNSARYINAFSAKHGIICSVTLAVPYNDELISYFSGYNIVQGPEDDVLTRYQMAAERFACDYVVRITSDCPFVPPYLISKAINLAVQDKLDYLTNADPRFRTAPDGHDVEVISKRMLEWLSQNAMDAADREHVTTFLQRGLPGWAKRGDIIGFIDLFRPECKLSIDTPDDLTRMREMYLKIFTATTSSPRAYRV